jgi:hypothetical protein
VDAILRHDLEEVFRRNAQHADEPALDRTRHFAEAVLAVVSFQYVDLGDWHFAISFGRMSSLGAIDALACRC